MKLIRNSIIACSATLLLCVGLLVGTTFAWFTDSVSNTGNVISAGNLAVQWEYRDAASDNEEDYQPVPSDTALFDEAQWTPGVSQSYDFRVTNVGSLTTT